QVTDLVRRTHAATPPRAVGATDDEEFQAERPEVGEAAERVSVIRLPRPRFLYRNSSGSSPTVRNLLSGFSHTTSSTLSTSQNQWSDANGLSRNSDPPHACCDWTICEMIVTCPRVFC